MKRLLTVLVALAVLASMAVPAVAVAQPAAAPTGVGDPIQAQTDENTTTNATDDETAPPGAMLAGSIGAQQAEIRGDVDQRAFGLQIAAAATNQSRAQLLAQNQERLQERLDGLHERLQTMNRSRANGSISEARYQAQVTEIHAQTAQVRTMANTSEQVAAGIPEDVLEANGVNVTAIHQLREQARTMTGPEVARIARTIAGENVGHPMGPPEGVPGGPPEERPGKSTQTPGGQGQGGHGGPSNMTSTVTVTPDTNTTSDSTPTTTGSDGQAE